MLDVRRAAAKFLLFVVVVVAWRAMPLWLRAYILWFSGFQGLWGTIAAFRCLNWSKTRDGRVRPVRPGPSGAAGPTFVHDDTWRQQYDYRIADGLGGAH